MMRDLGAGELCVPMPIMKRIVETPQLLSFADHPCGV